MVSTQPILFADHAPALGGAEHSLLLLLKHLDRVRWQPHLACTGGPLAERAAALTVPVHILPMPCLRRSPGFLRDWLAGARAMTYLARQAKAVLIHANTVRAAIYGALAAQFVRIPFVWHMRDFWLKESRPRYLWADTLVKRILCTASTGVLTNSHVTAAQLPCRGKVVIVHNGIEVEGFDTALQGGPFREQHGIPTDAPVAGTVGRLRPWKGQDCFLRSTACVREAMPNVWAIIVGGSPFGAKDDYPQRLRRLAADLDLADRVVFTGHLDDVRPALAAMDIFVHPGDPEPFGLVNLEAMAMEKPVVAFAHGALPEIVVHGKTGVLVSPGDETKLAEAVVALLNDPARRVAMGHAGRERVKARFDVRRLTREVEALYEALLA